jgi:flagellar protein FlgJ
MNIDSTPSPISSYHDFDGLARLRGSAANDPSANLKQAAQQFETYFLQHIMKTMRESIEKSDLFDNSASDTFQDMLDKEFATRMAERGSLGLADMLEKQLAPTLPESTQEHLANRIQSLNQRYENKYLKNDLLAQEPLNE